MWTRILAALIVPIVALTFASCDVETDGTGDVKVDPGKLPKYEVKKTEEGRAPDVDVTLPDVKVKGPDIDVKTEEKTITVPNVDVNMEKKTITVPDIDIRVPKEGEAATQPAD